LLKKRNKKETENKQKKKKKKNRKNNCIMEKFNCNLNGQNAIDHAEV
jgi:hypothetical protein